MVCITDGNSDHVAYVWIKTGLLSRKKLNFSTAVDLNKCLWHNKLPKSINTSAPSTGLPYSISTMLYSLQSHYLPAFRAKPLFFFIPNESGFSFRVVVIFRKKRRHFLNRKETWYVFIFSLPIPDPLKCRSWNHLENFTDLENLKSGSARSLLDIMIRKVSNNKNE